MDVDIRLLSAHDGKTTTFELWDGMKRIASVNTARPMTRDEMLALFRPQRKQKKAA